MHLHRIPVRFGDCDPAGIVYFPRFFDFFHQAMESWFARVGHDYDDLILGRRLGFPAVHTEADFRAPCHLGEVVVVEQRVERVGTKSIRFGYRIRGEADEREDEPRLTGATVCVVMDLDPKSPTFRQGLEIPGDLRVAAEAFVAGKA